MFAEERRERILEMLQEEQRVLANDLVERLHVSIDTIRRDLALLEKKGQLKRTHGGAVPAAKVRTFPSPSKVRYGEGSPQQNAVAKLAVSLIEAGDTVLISGASIHYVMLKYLPEDIRFTVITNSTVVAEALKERENIDTYMICGKLKSSGNITDAFAIEFVKTVKIDITFLVGGGLTLEHGVSTATPEGAAFQRATAESARRRVCLSTHEKLGNEAFARVVPAKMLDAVISDWDASKEEIAKLTDAGISVTAAEQEETE